MLFLCCARPVLILCLASFHVPLLLDKKLSSERYIYLVVYFGMSYRTVLRINFFSKTFEIYFRTSYAKLYSWSVPMFILHSDVTSQLLEHPKSKKANSFISHVRLCISQNYDRVKYTAQVSQANNMAYKVIAWVLIFLPHNFILTFTVYHCAENDFNLFKRQSFLKPVVLQISKKRTQF